MFPEELSRVLTEHAKWIADQTTGRRANLTRAVLTGATLPTGVPVVPNIDAAILAAIDAGGKLDMSYWHACATTHCRGGWATTLAGEAGAELAKRLGHNCAAALIYAASGSHPVPNWYESDKAALADLRRRANQDAAA